MAVKFKYTYGASQAGGCSRSCCRLEGCVVKMEYDHVAQDNPVTLLDPRPRHAHSGYSVSINGNSIDIPVLEADMLMTEDEEPFCYSDRYTEDQLTVTPVTFSLTGPISGGCSSCDVEVCGTKGTGYTYYYPDFDPEYVCVNETSEGGFDYTSVIVSSRCGITTGDFCGAFTVCGQLEDPRAACVGTDCDNSAMGIKVSGATQTPSPSGFCGGAPLANIYPCVTVRGTGLCNGASACCLELSPPP